MLLRANFIEERVRERQWSALLTRVSAVVLVLMAVMGTVIFFLLQMRERRLKGEIAQLQEETKRYEAAVTEHDEIQARIEAMQPLLEPLEKVHRGCESWWRLLVTLTNQMPRGLWWEEFASRKDPNLPAPEISIRGVGMDMVQVGDFALRLVGTPWFSEVQLVRTGSYVLGEKEFVSFEMTLRSRVPLGVREYKKEEEGQSGGGEK